MKKGSTKASGILRIIYSLFMFFFCLGGIIIAILALSMIASLSDMSGSADNILGGLALALGASLGATMGIVLIAIAAVVIIVSLTLFISDLITAIKTLKRAKFDDVTFEKKRKGTIAVEIWWLLQFGGFMYLGVQAVSKSDGEVFLGGILLIGMALYIGLTVLLSFIDINKNKKLMAEVNDSFHKIEREQDNINDRL